MSDSQGLINPQVAYQPGLKGFIRLRLRLIGHRLRGWRRELLLILRKPIAVAGLVIIGFYGLLGLTHPLLMSTVWDPEIYDPYFGFDARIAEHPSNPSMNHLLGTDWMGRDIFSQLAFATRTSFGVGLAAALIGTAIAIAVGLAAAYFRGKIDAVLMTLADTFLLLPPAIVLLIVGLIFDMNWLQVGIFYGVFVGFGSLALQVKAHGLTILGKPYVSAGRVAGGGSWRILRLHVLPNLAPLMAVNMLFIVTGSVLVEALLAYLQRTQLRMSWGIMIWTAQEGTSRFQVGEIFPVILPAAFSIMLFCGAFYMVGRALDEVTNPRLRAR